MTLLPPSCRIDRTYDKHNSYVSNLGPARTMRTVGEVPLESLPVCSVGFVRTREYVLRAHSR